MMEVMACGISLAAYAQFPPPAGQPGSTAIYKDSTVFISWSDSCIIELGYVNLMDTSFIHGISNKASYGEPADATGYSDDMAVSLGDNRIATIILSSHVYDGPGNDFAIFENGFGDNFLELAFVEVSSDGERFIRFPSVSFISETTQIPTFGTMDATRIHNLAGKYRMGYGTPFDLSDLADSAGINLFAISHIRIRDVGGCIQEGYQSYDSQGHVINDPWPTPFFTCGFDLESVGIINGWPAAVSDISSVSGIKLYPNPASDVIHILTPGASGVILQMRNFSGNLLYSSDQIQLHQEVDIQSFPEGLYLCIWIFPGGSTYSKTFVKL